MQDKKGKFTEGNKLGNRFTADNQPKNNGRKPSIYTQLKKLTKKDFNVELSKNDYDKTFAWVLEQTPADLKDLSNKEISDNIPLYMLSLIKAITADMENGNLNNLNSIMDRVFGKATNHSDVKVTDTNFSIKDIYKDEWDDEGKETQ